MITENGYADALDRVRPWVIAEAARRMHGLIGRGFDVRGYHHWTLVDNFEWDSGWDLRFGLYELDLATGERRARPSAGLYAAIARENALRPEIGPGGLAGPSVGSARVGAVRPVLDRPLGPVVAARVGAEHPLRGVERLLGDHVVGSAGSALAGPGPCDAVGEAPVGEVELQLAQLRVPVRPHDAQHAVVGRVAAKRLAHLLGKARPSALAAAGRDRLDGVSRRRRRWHSAA